ncbi:MAG: glycosyltransferase family 2 protein [Vicinamibacteria bacterium]|nr:glycosyltransferase family 2 protein [Vicinamibacteria bacterium]
MFPRRLVIVPAFNEEARIAETVAELRAEAAGWDVLVVNDCSTDGTVAAVRSCGATCLDLPVNLGIGGAMQAGFRWARAHDYDVVVQCDGDGQHPARYVDAVSRPVLAGECDLAIGSRFLNEGGGYRSTPMRRLGIRLLGLLIRALFGRHVTDCTSGFRAINRRLLHDFSHYYPLDYPEPEVCGLVLASGLRVVEVPVTMRQRMGGRSSISELDGALYVVKVGVALVLSRLRTLPE